MDVRCQAGKLHAVLGDGWIEIRCHNKWCGHRPGTVVIHRFDVTTGELIQTKKYAQPKEETRGAPCSGAAVRSA